MSKQCILVLLDNSVRAAERLALATRLASQWQCRLIGLYATYNADPTWFYLGEGAGRYVVEDRARRDGMREHVRKGFLGAVKDLPVEAEWRAVEGEPTAATLREVREADLIIAGQTDAADYDAFVAPQYLESILLESGRPVLVVPHVGSYETVGRRVLMAWNGSRQAARALHDAAPLLAGGQARLLCAASPARELHADATPVAHASRVLERHGVTVGVEHGPGGSDLAVGEMLLSRAADFDADMIVAGAYGRGRLRELILGGVTRTLLDAMTMPVLFSH